MDSVLGLLAVGVALGLYLIPTIVATYRNHPNIGTIVVLNAALGWTIIGWLIALAMSLNTPQRRDINIM